MAEKKVSSPVRLDGKSALITGGTSGIGLATAQLFHEAGARVMVTGLHEESVARARRELPGEVEVVAVDARSVAATAQLAERVEARFGTLDVVFLNAGIAKLAPFESVDEAHYDEQMDTNVKGVVFTLQHVLPRLARGASVILNSSVASLVGAANMTIYAATKGALSALTRSLAVELAPRKIRVNALAPAMIHTEIQRKFGLPAEVMLQVERATNGKIPLGRFGEPREVAMLALFLASDAASFITGTELPVDGGYVAV